MKICGFEVINNGLTNREYAEMTGYCPPTNEYLITNKTLKLSFFGIVDQEKGTIEVTDTTYDYLEKVHNRRNIEHRTFWCRKLC